MNLYEETQFDNATTIFYSEQYHCGVWKSYEIKLIHLQNYHDKQSSEKQISEFDYKIFSVIRVLIRNKIILCHKGNIRHSTSKRSINIQLFRNSINDIGCKEISKIFIIFHILQMKLYYHIIN